MQTEHETFLTLLTDLPHWEFEIFLIVIFDGIIGLLIWPRIVKFFKHHEEDDKKIEELESKLEKLARHVDYREH